jgi:glucose/arabinose dehydrogenase
MTAKRHRSLALTLAGLVAGPPCFPAATWLPYPFAEVTVVAGLTGPTVVRFSADGRIFVAEKRGTVLAFDGLDDAEPDLVVDLSGAVSSMADRGLLGLALDPGFPTVPWLYVLYTYDAPPGGRAPTWGDACPDPPGANVDGCVVSARLSRFQVGPDNTVIGTEEVLLSDNWCQQFSSHSIGTVAFGPDGALYVGAGDGANFRQDNGAWDGADFGQLGGSAGSPTPANPCSDPPVPAGGSQTPPQAQGGALRSQDLRTPGDPVSFDGAILRLDPATGEALPDNPLSGGPIADDDRVIAYGLRNPFRFFVHPRTGEIWIGDVGWNTWEEIDRIAAPADAVVENFGWPCYEGAERQPRYDAVDLDVCEDLYQDPEATAPPFFAYRHGAPPDPAHCGTGPTAAITAVAFYLGGGYPRRYDGALVFADAFRSCIWTMLAGPGGLPDPGRIATLAAGAGSPVQVEIGPDGDLFYVDLSRGEIRRILVDPGALFGDGFESGDAGAWSQPNVPGV